MRKMRNFLILTAATLLITVGCDEEFLTKEPKAALAGPSIENADGVEGKLISAYRTLQGTGMDGGGTWYYSTWSWIFGLQDTWDHDEK